MDFLIPLIASADGSSLSIKQLVFKISYNILNPLIKLGFVIALIVFVWQVAEFIRHRNAGSVETSAGSKEGFTGILWGLFGLLIMVSVFAIMQVINNILGAKIPLPS